jgi:hypothetical protein
VGLALLLWWLIYTGVRGGRGLEKDLGGSRRFAGSVALNKEHVGVGEMKKMSKIMK